MQCKLHPVQVTRQPSNFAPEIKIRFKDFSEEIYKKNQIQLIFHWEAKPKVMFKKSRYSINSIPRGLFLNIWLERGMISK